MAAETTNGNGFAQKALIIGLSALFVMLVSFFAWLALAVIEIRVNVAAMAMNIESLLDTRRTQATEERANTKGRLDELEKAER